MKRILVTGGGRGIGRAAALRLARDGFDVAVHFRSSGASASETCQAIIAAGGRASTLAFDVCDRDQCRDVLLADVERHGPFWGVVCNAGTIADGAFPSLTGDAWDRVLRTNLDSFYNVLHPLVMPMVRRREGGRIVTISSVAGLTGHRGQVNYAASKAGLIGATRALAQELAKRQITVNSVAPGLIETEMIANVPVDEVMRMIPMRRLGKPEEVAAVVAFLCSDGAAYITGQVISINGGIV
jgi:3-oxoacyl-[acyl-carrier protein] reductase